MQLDMNTAKNVALRENVFMMAICIELRIPLFLVGKPGSSKSLAKSIIAKSMLGQGSQTKLLKSFKQVKMKDCNSTLLLSLYVQIIYVLINILPVRCAWCHTSAVSFQPQKLLLKCSAEPWPFSESKAHQILLPLLYWMKWALLRILLIYHWKLFTPCWRMVLKVLTALNRYKLMMVHKMCERYYLIENVPNS